MRTGNTPLLSSAAKLGQDASGSVFVEYIIVAVVALSVAVALVGLGPAVVKHYSKQRAALYQAYP